MMTMENVRAMAEALGDDAFVYGTADMLHITLCDFGGFDAEWNEIDREYDNPEAVATLLAMLQNEAIEIATNLYTTYRLNGFSVQLGYESFDI